MSHSMHSIWRNDRFVRFFASYTIGNLGDWFDIFALQIIFVHDWHASPFWIGLLLLAFMLPGAVFGPVIGVWVDRLSNRQLLLLSDALSALLTLGLYLSQSVAVALLLIVLRSIAAAVNAPVQQSYVKKVTSSEQLLKASSYTAVAFQMCKVLGPLLGALLLVWISPRACLLINVASFVISVAILWGLPPDLPNIAVSTRRQSLAWWRSLAQALRFVWQKPRLRTLLLVSGVWYFCGIIRLGQTVVYLAKLYPQQLGYLGWVLSVDGLGAVLAGMWLARCTITHYSRGFAAGFVVLSLCIAILASLPVATALSWVLAVMFVLGLGSGINVVMYSYMLKREPPQSMMGVVAGLAQTVQNGSQALGSLLGGLWIAYWGIQPVYAGIAVVMMLLALCCVFVAWRYREA